MIATGGIFPPSPHLGWGGGGRPHMQGSSFYIKSVYLISNCTQVWISIINNQWLRHYTCCGFCKISYHLLISPPPTNLPNTFNIHTRENKIDRQSRIWCQYKFYFPANGSTNTDVFQPKSFQILRGIIPQNFSSLGFAVWEKLGNRQTDRQTHSLTDRCFTRITYFCKDKYPLYKPCHTLNILPSILKSSPYLNFIILKTFPSVWYPTQNIQDTLISSNSIVSSIYLHCI